MYINGQPCGGAFFRGERIFDATPKDEPFYIEDISGSANTLSIAENDESAYSINVEKSTDGITWESIGYTSINAITAVIPAYGKLYLRARTNFWGSASGYGNIITASGRHNVGGNIMSLLQGSSFDGLTRNLTSVNTYAFCMLFYGNTNLVSAEKLILNNTVVGRCYQQMFRDCTSLTTAPSILPATTLAIECYISMFQGCTSLTTAPTLPATTLASGCYYQMFRGCTSLTTAPSLPATTLTTYCYDSMFRDCTALTTAPDLPAATLVQACYQRMFQGCSSLNYIKCLATNISANYCVREWVNNIAASGTFIKDAEMASWPTGYSGIPSNWTVQDAA